MKVFLNSSYWTVTPDQPSVQPLSKYLLCCAAATKPSLLKSVLFINSSLYQGVRPRSMCRSRPLPVWGRLARRRLFQRYESAFSSRSQTFPHPRSFASPPIAFALSAPLSSGEHTHTNFTTGNDNWPLVKWLIFTCNTASHAEGLASGSSKGALRAKQWVIAVSLGTETSLLYPRDTKLHLNLSLTYYHR